MKKLKNFFGTEQKSKIAKKMQDILNDAVIETFHRYWPSGFDVTEIVTYIDGKANTLVSKFVNDYDHSERKKFTAPKRRYRVSLIVPDTGITEYIGIIDKETGKCIAYSPEHPVSHTEQDAWNEILQTVYAVWSKHTVTY